MRRRIPFIAGILFLNLTGLGLGYLALRRWERAKACFVISVSLWLLAVLVKTYAPPALHLGNVTLVLNAVPLVAAVSAFWLLSMALDGAYLARLADPSPFVAGLTLLLGWAVCILFYSSLFFYEYSAERVYNKGMTAYQNADCQTAEPYFEQFDGIYRISLNSRTAQADAHLNECRLLLHIQQAEQYGFYEEALNAIPHVTMPALKPAAEVFKLKTYQDWSKQLAAQGNYEKAIQILMQTVPALPDGEQKESLRNQTALYIIALADKHYSEGDNDGAIAILNQAINEYAAAPALDTARHHLATLYLNKAEKAFNAGHWQEALQAYQQLHSDFASIPEVQPSTRQMVTLYTRLAESDWSQQDYQGAVDAYQTLLKNYPASVSAANLHLKLGQIYQKWAPAARQQGQYETALRLYQLLQSDYADTLAVNDISDQLPYIYLEWIDDLAYNDQFDQALARLQQMRDAYPNNPIADHIAEKYVQLYLLWGKSLLDQQKYTEATQKYNQARQYMYRSNEIAIDQAMEGYNQALAALASDNGAEGKALLSETLQTACNGQVAASPALDSTGGVKKGLLCQPAVVELPAELLAATPGEFHFVVLSSKGETTLEVCPASSPAAGVERKQRWLSLVVKSASSGAMLGSRRFTGSMPPACAALQTSASAVYGSDPVWMEWLSQFLH